jgi:hypothetical protein
MHLTEHTSPCTFPPITLLLQIKAKTGARPLQRQARRRILQVKPIVKNTVDDETIFDKEDAVDEDDAPGEADKEGEVQG